MADQETKEIPPSQSGINFQESEENYNISVQVAKKDVGRIGLAGGIGATVGALVGEATEEVANALGNPDLRISGSLGFLGLCYGLYASINNGRNEGRQPQ